MKAIQKAVKKVFCSAFYAVLAAVFCFLLAAFVILLPNFRLVKEIFSGSGAAFLLKLRLVVYLLSGVINNYTIFSAAELAVLSILFGANIAMFVYYFKNKNFRAERGTAGIFLGGTLSGILGAGCAACGVYFLGAFLSFGGALGVIALLPFKGSEFIIAGAALLITSLYLVSRGITQPENLC